MYCRKCGKEIPENSAVCPACGAGASGKKSVVGGGSLLGDDKRDNVTKLMMLIGAVVSIISTFLPFATASAFGMSETVSYVNGGEGDGIIAIILSVVVLVLVFLNKPRKFSVIPAGLTICMLVYEMISLSDAADSAFGLAEVSMGIGFWLILAANIAIIVGAVRDFMDAKAKNSAE